MKELVAPSEMVWKIITNAVSRKKGANSGLFNTVAEIGAAPK
jgi:hypothetical protein